MKLVFKLIIFYLLLSTFTSGIAADKFGGMMVVCFMA
ncbi:hypothetical protein MNBD_GAMMA22-845 [hydrothermal vent metagenome]|uniref:Uncharacterized protein n=1 Tax=hydrothermal vent metagenome TaxID=652676 RepID=A0A3B1A7L6_9ZZZZ